MERNIFIDKESNTLNSTSNLCKIKSSIHELLHSQNSVESLTVSDLASSLPEDSNSVSNPITNYCVDEQSWSEQSSPKIQPIENTASNSVVSFASSCDGLTLDRPLCSPTFLQRSSQQLEAKVDMVYSLLSMLSDQEHADMGETLLVLSASPESCMAMRQSGCIPLLVQLMQSDKNVDIRIKASKALNNLVYSQRDSKLKKREIRIFKLLEQVRSYIEYLKEIKCNLTAPKWSVNTANGHPTCSVAHIMKLSFDEGYRQAICLLGGLQTLANLIEVEHVKHENVTNSTECVLLRRYACMALTNLTFGDSGNKALLCSFREFMRVVVLQLQHPSEELKQVTASVLRNLSWRADNASKETLREVGSITSLMKAAIVTQKENTLKSILSALWNLSAHCTENKAEICNVESALGFLVTMLTYKSPSRSLAIIENAGGILRNISSQIAVRDDYRECLRQQNCLQILLDQLKSPSLTIVSNACGTLWNLSAKCVQDQEALWSMGAPCMLRSLNHSKHKMIAVGSSAALKNLLMAKPLQDISIPLDSTALAMDLPVLPSLDIRKQKALLQELDASLTERLCNKNSILQISSENNQISMDVIKNSDEPKNESSSSQIVDESLSVNAYSLHGHANSLPSFKKMYTSIPVRKTRTMTMIRDDNVNTCNESERNVNKYSSDFGDNSKERSLKEVYGTLEEKDRCSVDDNSDSDLQLSFTIGHLTMDNEVHSKAYFLENEDIHNIQSNEYACDLLSDNATNDDILEVRMENCVDKSNQTDALNENENDAHENTIMPSGNVLGNDSIVETLNRKKQKAAFIPHFDCSYGILDEFCDIQNDSITTSLTNDTAAIKSMTNNKLYQDKNVFIGEIDFDATYTEDIEGKTLNTERNEKFNTSTIADSTIAETTYSTDHFTLSNLSTSPPNVISFQSDEFHIPKRSANSNFMNELSDSTLIIQEATRIAQHFQEDSTLSDSTSLIFNLDDVQPPSHLNSIITSTLIDEETNVHKQQKPFFRPKPLNANIIKIKTQRKQLLNHGISLDSLEHFENESGFSDHSNSGSTNSLPHTTQNTNGLKPEREFLLNCPITTFSTQFPKWEMHSNSITDLENINPPSLLNQITDLYNSLTDIATDTLSSDTDIANIPFECFESKTDMNLNLNALISSPKKIRNPNVANGGNRSKVKKISPMEKRRQDRSRYETQVLDKPTINYITEIQIRTQSEGTNIITPNFDPTISTDHRSQDSEHIYQAADYINTVNNCLEPESSCINYKTIEKRSKVTLNANRSNEISNVQNVSVEPKNVTDDSHLMESNDDNNAVKAIRGKRKSLYSKFALNPKANVAQKKSNLIKPRSVSTNLESSNELKTKKPMNYARPKSSAVNNNLKVDNTNSSRVQSKIPKPGNTNCTNENGSGICKIPKFIHRPRSTTEDILTRKATQSDNKQQRNCFIRSKSVENGENCQSPKKFVGQPKNQLKLTSSSIGVNKKSSIPKSNVVSRPRSNLCSSNLPKNLLSNGKGNICYRNNNKGIKNACAETNAKSQENIRMGTYAANVNVVEDEADNSSKRLSRLSSFIIVDTSNLENTI